MNTERRVIEIELDDILPNRFQPRIKFSDQAISELSESIKEHGIIQPIVVRKVGDRYEIIAGERRYKAATMAGLKTVPAIVTDLNDKDSAEVALIENVQRQDLTPIEEAISYRKILDMGYLTQEKLAEKLGKSQSSVANKLRLLNLDEEVQEALLNEKISERHARSLLKLINHADQVKLLNKIMNERLTVRKTDEEINKMINEVQHPSEIETLDLEEPVVIGNDLSFENINKDNQFIPGNPIFEEENGITKFEDLITPTTKMDEPELSQGKFFDILGETNESNQQASTIENQFDNPTNTQKEDIFDINSIYMPIQEKPELENASNINTNTFVTKDIKTVINTVRNCADTIEKYGFSVDLEEFDLEDTYQVVFKVSKK